MIEITWETVEVITDEGGGDTVSSTLGFITLDGAETERYSKRAEIAQHAVERDADISDNVRRQNLDLSFDVFSASDPATARENLFFVINNGLITTIQTGIGEYENVILTSFEEQRNHRTGDALVGVLTGQQIRRVDTEEVEAPSPIVERGRRRTRTGQQSTRTTTNTDTEPTEAANNRSTELRAIARALTDMLSGGD